MQSSSPLVMIIVQGWCRSTHMKTIYTCQSKWTFCFFCCFTQIAQLSLVLILHSFFCLEFFTMLSSNGFTKDYTFLTERNFWSDDTSLEATDVSTEILLVLVSSDKVVLSHTCSFKLASSDSESETTVSQNIYQTSCQNMLVSHILGNVNNFM